MTRIMRSVELGSRPAVHPKEGKYYSLTRTPRTPKTGPHRRNVSLTTPISSLKARVDPVSIRYIADLGFQSQKLADSSIDVESDIIRISQRRDADLLSKVNQALSYSEPNYKPACSVSSRKPMTSGSVRACGSNKHLISKNCPRLKNIEMTSIAPPPKVVVQLESVRSPSDLLSREHRMLANETIDLSPPISCSALRQQLSNMKLSLNRHGELLGKHLTSEDEEVNSVIRSIQKSRSERTEAE